MAKVLYGYVNHYVNSEGISFSLHEIDKKNIDDENAVNIYNPLNVNFEIWKAFKNNKVKITIEKV